jgi:hypothetical protein
MRLPRAIADGIVSRLAILLLATLQGCTVEPDVELALEVDSLEPAVIAETGRVLAARFEEFRPTLLSSTASVIEGSTIRFTFRNGAPEPGVLEYLYATPGRVRAALITDRFGSAWFTDKDIRQAAVVYSDSMRALRVRLTPEAGQRLLRLTSENLGQLVAMTLDGETLMEARINGTFGEQFQIAGQQLDPDLDVALAVILTTGALPADVRAVSSP